MPVFSDCGHELLVEPVDGLAPLLLVVFDKSNHILEDFLHGVGYFINLAGVFVGEFLFELLIDLLGIFFLHPRIFLYNWNILQTFRVQSISVK